MKPRKRKGNEEKKTEAYEGKSVRKRLSRIRRPNKTKKTGDRKD